MNTRMAIEAGNQPFLANFTSDALLTNHMIGGTAFPMGADDSGLTCNDNNVIFDGVVAPPSSRKRSRDYYGDIVSQRIMSSPSAWFEQEAALQMQKQQMELDCLLAQHTQRLMLGIEERAKKQSKALASAIRAAVATKLREKEEEIQRVTKLNWILQERMRNLCAENQLWRGLAQSNEAAVNSLRTDLERVLTTSGAGEYNRNLPTASVAAEEDAESCCGSNEDGMGRKRRRCKGCEEEESEGELSSAGVVVMPCRHAFMQCKRCEGSSSCPVCGSQITATLHVHLP